VGQYDTHLLCESDYVSINCTSDRCSSEFEMSEKRWWVVTSRGSGSTLRITCLCAAWFTINPT
jgi:hypothetical protein